MREFESGATRNSLEGKLSYMRALSPEVLREYVSYLAKHRQTPDGLREFDNWKKGIPTADYCDSLLRHVFDAWLMKLGYEPSDGNYNLKDLLCAIMFNAQGWLFELIHAEEREQLDVLAERDRVEAEYDKGVEASVGPFPLPKLGENEPKYNKHGERTGMTVEEFQAIHQEVRT